MNKFRGAWTALVTPFLPNRAIDYGALEKLLEYQIAGGIDGILLLGTTGEAPTLDQDEKRELVDFSIKQIAGRTKVMVNVGTNNTRESELNIAYYNSIQGIDAYLVVNPYYNKPTQTGLFLHFKTLANATDKPVFLYNIRGRTGVNLETPTLLHLLAECPNIIGVKEASGDIGQIREVITQASGGCLVFSGDDALTAEVLKSGGDGVISVASNLFPQTMTDMVRAGLAHNEQKTNEIHTKMLPFFEGQFMQTNPLPIKTSLVWRSLITESFRLPMCPMDDLEKKQWKEICATYEEIR